MLPPEWEIPLKTAALPGVLSRYSPQFHQPDVLLCAPQDYPYVRCSRNYRHSVECKHKNSCFCCLLLACFLGLPTKSNCLSCADQPFPSINSGRTAGMSKGSEPALSLMKGRTEFSYFRATLSTHPKPRRANFLNQCLSNLH